MKRYDYTVVGGATMVQMLKFHKLPSVGKTATPTNLNPQELHFGGCAFNMYSGLAKLGASVFPVLSHAHPLMAERLHSDCEQYGVPETGIFGPDKERYYQCLMMGDESGNHITIAYWYGKDVGDTGHQRKPIVMQDAFFENSNMAILVIGTPETGWQTVDMAKKHDIPLVYSYRNDPLLAPEDMLRYILDETSILFTNEVEARSIERQFGYDHITDLFRAAKAQTIVTTLGKRGCIVYDKTHGKTFDEYLVPVTENEVGNVDAVGAGDAFVAGFMYGLSKGQALPTCAQYGSTASSFVIEKDGSTTNLPTEQSLLARNACRPDAK